MDRTEVSIFANLGSEAVIFDVHRDHRLLLSSETGTELREGKLTVPPDGFVMVSSELD
jgi:hypothetical protein